MVDRREENMEKKGGEREERRGQERNCLHECLLQNENIK